MMLYEVQYKCYLSDSIVPLIRYRYRKAGKCFWERKDRVYIDDFAYLHWYDEYYAHSDHVILAMPMYERMSIMREIIDKEYDGNLVDYVRAMIKYEILNNTIQNDNDHESIEIAMSFVTDDWKTVSVAIGE